MKTFDSPIMQPMKVLAAFATATLLSFPALAQTPVNPSYDPKAKAILDEVSKTAKAYTSIQATFSITFDKGTTKEVKEGSVTIKGKKYHVTMKNKVKEKFYNEEYINDTKTNWSFTEKENEVTIDNAPDPNKETKEGFSPNNIFTIHEKGFKYKFDKEETQNGRVVQLITLYPEKPDKKNYSSIKIVVDKVKKQIVSATMMNKDGTKTIYTVKTFTSNQEVPDTTFTFDMKAHPNVEVIDLRDDK
jgi:outer membrane lipoprotein-sorting protein